MEVTAAQTINDIKLGLSSKANYFPPGTTGYKAITSSYFWSSSKQDPLGVIQPATPGDIAIILVKLSGAPKGLRFAVKAGSHIAPAGFNATGGILIDLSLFEFVVYHPETELVDVGPGSLWQGVYEYLKPLGRSVNGATSCQGVGVAGFNLGGGFGNKANQFGLAMDTVQAIEVVLPTGKIKTVDAKQDSDIFWALKGGGNNFGIVTKWTMSTYPQDKVYFVQLDFEQQYFNQVQEAIWAYIQHQVPKSNVETKFEWTTTTEGVDEPLAFSHAELFYDGPEPPAGLFDAFLKIPNIKENSVSTWSKLMDCLPTQHQTYGVGLVNGLNDLPDNFRGRYTHIMLSRYTPDLIKRVLELAEGVGKNLSEHRGLQFYPDIWPGSPTMFKNSPPSAWPRPPDHGANFPLPIRCLWEHKKDDEFWVGTLRALTKEIHAYAVEQGCTTADAPVYYNLALDGTDVRDIYRGNLEKLRIVRRKCDPSGVMDRTGGFRIPI